MMKGKILISLLTMISLSLQVNAITWKEFLDALENIDGYEFPENARNKQVSCWKRVYWEEYIEGNSDYRGYVNSYTDEFEIDCPF